VENQNGERLEGGALRGETQLVPKLRGGSRRVSKKWGSFVKGGGGGHIKGRGELKDTECISMQGK